MKKHLTAVLAGTAALAVAATGLSLGSSSPVAASTATTAAATKAGYKLVASDQCSPKHQGNSLKGFAWAKIELYKNGNRGYYRVYAYGQPKNMKPREPRYAIPITHLTDKGLISGFRMNGDPKVELVPTRTNANNPAAKTGSALNLAPNYLTMRFIYRAGASEYILSCSTKAI